MRYFWKSKKNKLSPNSPDWWRHYFEKTEKIDPKKPSRMVDFVVIDLEATGLDIHKDRILSFGLIPVQNFEMWPGQSFQCFVQQSYFDRETIPIHGLLRSDIEHGLQEKDFLKTIIPLLAGKVIVGHHIGFDLAMINHALKRHFNVNLINPHIDTGVLYKKAYPSKFIYNKFQSPVPSLDEIAQEFDIITQDRHSALGDAQTTAFIFMKLWRQSEHGQRSSLKDLL